MNSWASFQPVGWERGRPRPQNVGFRQTLRGAEVGGGVKMAICSIIILLVLVPGNWSEAISFGQPARSGQNVSILESLPPSNDQELRKIRDAGDWHNPRVLVNRDGYELILNNQPRNPALLTLEQLEQTLLKTSRDHWPLGKVIAIAENGLRSPGDNPKITSNLKKAIRMLKSHKLRVEHWPSG
jgi:hypothetical protein